MAPLTLALLLRPFVAVRVASLEAVLPRIEDPELAQSPLLPLIEA